MKTRIEIPLLAALLFAVFMAEVHAQSTTFTILAITNPTPAVDGFGYSVAGVGTDKLVIGAYRDDVGAPDSGVAYLYDLNGTRLTTFTNPTPAFSDGFGWSVAGVGNDKVLVGANADSAGAGAAGAAHLFNLAGVRLATFTNPTPVANDQFGWSVAAVGSNMVVACAVSDNTGATDAGAAYLFDLNGSLLATFTNPTPQMGDNFGYSVAGVGADKVVVGANRDNTGAALAGAAYLFNTNGTLFRTFTNPTPQASDFSVIPWREWATTWSLSEPIRTTLVPPTRAQPTCSV